MFYAINAVLQCSAYLDWSRTFCPFTWVQLAYQFFCCNIVKSNCYIRMTVCWRMMVFGGEWWCLLENDGVGE